MLALDSLTENTYVHTVGHLSFKGYKFCEWSKKGVCGNYFYKTTLVALFTIHVNLYVMEFPLIFGEINFVEVPKIVKFMALEERAPYGMYFPLKSYAFYIITGELNYVRVYIPAV